MIQFDSFTLANGLKAAEDPSVQIAVMNILYNVGSRDEDPEPHRFRASVWTFDVWWLG